MNKQRIAKCKKGSIQDITYIFVSIVTIFIIILIVYKVSDELNTKFRDSPQVNESTNKGLDAYDKINDMYPRVIDNSMLLLVIGLAIGAIALASMVRIHPVFFIFFLLILVILIFISAVFSNIYQKVADNDEFRDLADGTNGKMGLTYITYIMQFLPFITGIIGFLMSFVMYKNWQNG